MGYAENKEGAGALRGSWGQGFVISAFLCLRIVPIHLLSSLVAIISPFMNVYGPCFVIVIRPLLLLEEEEEEEEGGDEGGEAEERHRSELILE
jgi:hypothetical protein